MVLFFYGYSAKDLHEPSLFTRFGTHKMQILWANSVTFEHLASLDFTVEKISMLNAVRSTSGH